MHVSMETTQGLERKLTIQVPAKKIDEEVNLRLSDLAKKVKIDGFRPGKVPTRVVRERYASSVRQEVARDLVQSSLYEAMKEKELTPAGAPFVVPGEIKNGEDFEFTATFEVFPEISLNELDGQTVERVIASVDEKDIEQTVEKLREQHKEWVEVSQAAKSGDKIQFDFEGFIGDEAFEGGKATDYSLVLGEGSMIPGFEEGLEGLKAGDEKDLTVTFPEKYNQESLAGKEAVFKIKMHKVLEGKSAELNEALFEKLGIKEGGAEALKADIRKNMERELERQLIQMNKDNVFEVFLKANEIDIPKAMVEKEVEHLRKDMLQRVFGNQPVDTTKLPELPATMFEPQAKRRVHLGLLFSEFVKQHEVVVDPKRVESYLEDMANSYEKPEEVLEWYRGNKERMGEIEAAVLEEQTVLKMAEKATIVEKTMDYDTVMNKPQSQPEEKTED